MARHSCCSTKRCAGRRSRGALRYDLWGIPEYDPESSASESGDRLPPLPATTAAVSMSSRRDSVDRSSAIPRPSSACITRFWPLWRAGSTAPATRHEESCINGSRPG